jgi:predicted DNA binding protein
MGHVLDVTVQDLGSPLQTAVGDYEGVEIELQPSVAYTGSVTPVARIRVPASIETEAIEAIEFACGADPSISSYRRLNDDSNNEAAMSTPDSHRNERHLYRIEWIDEQSVLGQLVEGTGTVTSATLNGGGWHACLVFATREDLSTAHEVWETNHWEIEVNRIVTGVEVPSVTTGLTDQQHQTLKRALEMGYYEIPRKSTQTEVAADLDISHQALSECLRRAIRNLVTTVIHAPDEPEEPEKRKERVPLLSTDQVSELTGFVSR